jgi:signal transduction histidine kinase
VTTRVGSRASFTGQPAPVAWADVRRPARMSRFVVGLVLLVLAAVAWAVGVPGAVVKAGAALIVLGSLLLDGRFRTPLAALTVDASCLLAAAGLGGEVKGPLVGAAALVTAASILLLPVRLVPLPLGALGVGVAARLVILPPSTQGGPGTASALAAVETALYLVVLATLVLGVARAMLVARDRQEQAREAEARAAAVKDQFASLVSHELRTPLTNISGFATALREAWTSFDPAEVDEFLGVICRESDHLRALIDDVLVVPRLEAGRLLIEPADFPLRPAAYRIAGLVFPPGGSKSVSVSVGGSVVVRADPNRVEQVLRNLLGNAARHGGSQVSIEAAPLGSEWLVTVADDGPGVDPTFRERIFAPFEQVEAGAGLGRGMGLGLSVCRVLVGAMGGRIWYEHGFPTGARFCFTLPAAVSPRGALVAAPPPD